MTKAARALLLAVLAAWPALLVLLATARGPGISIDSVSYVSAAQSFASTGGFTAFDGLPLTIFPTGYPALLALLTRVGLSLDAAVVGLNVVCVVLIVLGAYVLARLVLRSEGWALGVAAFASLLAATVRTASYAWSEGPFTVLALAALLVAVRMIERRSRSWGWVIALGILVSLACTMRYVGIVLVPIAALAAWWASRSGARVVVAIVLGLLGPIVVAARNLSLGVGPFGERFPGSRTVQGAVNGLVDVLGSYVAPPQTTALTALAGALVLVLLAAAAWLAVIRRDRLVGLIAVFVALYWLAIVYGQTAARLDSMTERLAAPALVPMLVLAAVAIRALIGGMASQLGESGLLPPARADRLVAGVFAVAGVLVLALSVTHALRFVGDARESGLGLASDAAEAAPVALAARAVPIGEGIATNDPWAAWWARQGGIALGLPVSPAEWPQARVDADLQRLMAAIDADRVSVLILDPAGQASLDLDALTAAGIAVSDAEVVNGVTVARLG